MKGIGHAQVWWADFPNEKIRPVVILTRARVAERLVRVVVAPITTTARGLATEVELGSDEGVQPGSFANLDNVQLLDVNRLLHRAGRVSRTRWPVFCRAMAQMMAC